MEPTRNKPVFDFLGHNIQKINYERYGNEDVREIIIKIAHTNYNKDNMIYSLILEVIISLENTKDNVFQVLGGFKINDDKFLENESAPESILAATLYPYVRNLIHSVSADDRAPITLPTIDLRYIDMKKSIVITKKQ